MNAVPSRTRSVGSALSMPSRNSLPGNSHLWAHPLPLRNHLPFLLHLSLTHHKVLPLAILLINILLLLLQVLPKSSSLTLRVPTTCPATTRRELLSTQLHTSSFPPVASSTVLIS